MKRVSISSTSVDGDEYERCRGASGQLLAGVLEADLLEGLPGQEAMFASRNKITGCYVAD
jgi:hypothetical protein